MLTLAAWPAVLGASLACFVIGGFWFSPLMFGDAWVRELHAESRAENRAVGALLALPAAIVAAFVLGVLIASVGATTAAKGILVGLLVWLGFCAAIHIPAVYLEGRPIRFAIDSGHKLAICVAMGAILGIWG